ncbi:Sulfite efflux pump SSU1 [Rhodotorula toruloides]|nr:Sulfite efflux pump SSU1 [Rhodotorula toruloides]
MARRWKDVGKSAGWNGRISREFSLGGHGLMGWWGLTFPIGTHAVAAATLGRQLGSTAFKVVGTVESVAVVLLWIYIAGMTTVKSIEGSIFSAPCLGPTGQPPKEAPRKKRP